MQVAAQSPSRPVPNASPAPRPGGPAPAAGWPQAGVEAPREMRFAPGQTVFFDGDEALHFFEIVSGTVRCCRLTPDGRRQIYRFAAAGDMLGLGGEAQHSYSAEAVTAVVARRHRLAALDAAMAREARLRERVLAALRDELAAVRLQMVLLGQMSAAERVAAFLLALAAQAGGARLGDLRAGKARVGEAGVAIHLPMTRVDIADYLGLTIETVSRKINELKRLGIIELTTPNLVRIAEPERLEAIAEAA